MNLFPLVSFDLIDNARADAALVEWGHWLGGCNRPFGRHSFGLFVEGELRAVAVSASPVNARCGGFDRLQIVELARLCAHPEHRDLTRVALRLWRRIGPLCWSREYWPVIACVSYANALRHTGDIYRFDGWKKVADVKGGTAGSTWKRPRQKTFEPKSVWAYVLTEQERNGLSGAIERRRTAHLPLPEQRDSDGQQCLPDLCAPERIASAGDGGRAEVDHSGGVVGNRGQGPRVEYLDGAARYTAGQPDPLGGAA